MNIVFVIKLVAEERGKSPAAATTLVSDALVTKSRFYFLDISLTGNIL
jgi:hypothetical protein